MFCVFVFPEVRPVRLLLCIGSLFLFCPLNYVTDTEKCPIREQEEEENDWLIDLLVPNPCWW